MGKKRPKWWLWFTPLIGGIIFIYDLIQWITGEEEYFGT